MSTPDNESAAESPVLLRQSLSLLGNLLVPAGTITGLLYYFGYVRERALFSYFGVNVSLLGFNTSDYVLRSSQAVFSPLVFACLIAMVLLTVDQVLGAVRRHGPPPWWRTSWIVAAGVSTVGLALGAVGLHSSVAVLGPELSAVALGLGVLVLEHCVWMASSDPGLPASIRESLRAVVWQRRLLVGLLTLVAAFWWAASAASANGFASAKAIEASLETRSEAVVLSHRRLGIEGSGVRVESLSAKASGFSFRYTGLRVLYHSQDRWFLVPQGWTHSNGELVILLPDPMDGVRVDVGP